MSDYIRLQHQVSFFVKLLTCVLTSILIYVFLNCLLQSARPPKHITVKGLPSPMIFRFKQLALTKKRNFVSY